MCVVSSCVSSGRPVLVLATERSWEARGGGGGAGVWGQGEQATDKHGF